MLHVARLEEAIFILRDGPTSPYIPAVALTCCGMPNSVQGEKVTTLGRCNSDHGAGFQHHRCNTKTAAYLPLGFRDHRPSWHGPRTPACRLMWPGRQHAPALPLIDEGQGWNPPSPVRTLIEPESWHRRFRHPMGSSRFGSPRRGTAPTAGNDQGQELPPSRGSSYQETVSSSPALGPPVVPEIN